MAERGGDKCGARGCFSQEVDILDPGLNGWFQAARHPVSLGIVSRNHATQANENLYGQIIAR